MYPVHQPIAAFPPGSLPSGTIHNHLQRHQIYIHQNHGAETEKNTLYSCYIQVTCATNEPI